MNLDELRAARSKERQTDSLQHLRTSFYDEAAAYIDERKDERDSAAAAADDPFASTEVRQLTDEIETAREVVEAIYERRLGKLVKNASLAAGGIPVDQEGLTAEERDLFEDLVDRIEQNKSRVLATVDGDADAVPATTDGADDTVVEGSAETRGPESAPADAHDDADHAANEPADPPGDHETSEGAHTVAPTDSAEAGGDDASPAAGEGDDTGATDGGVTERTTVRVTGDVDEFYGIDDREYDLDPDDVVALPATNAEPLLQRDVAERVD